MNVYKIILIVAIICIAIGFATRPKKMKLKNFNQANKTHFFLSKLDKLINKNKYIYKAKNKYISKLKIINIKHNEHNNELILKYLAFDTAISILLLLILSRIITMWYAVITISFVVFYLIIFLGISRVESKINKIHCQFPTALQCFLDEYIIHKNIKNAVDSSYGKMPDAVGKIFEMLARELSGEKKPEIAITKFANELSYVWGYCFAEILIMSLKGAGDITDDLLTLNSMVSEEITASEEEKSSRFGNKMTFIVIYAFALTGVIINLFMNNLAGYLYFYTSMGNSLIAVWLIVLIAGITIISLSEKGR